MKREDALRKSAQGYAHRVSSSPSVIYFVHKNGRYWSSFGDNHKELTASGVKRLPLENWVPDFPNAFWAEKIGGFASEPAKPGLLQLVAAVRGYKELIGTLSEEVKAAHIGDEWKPLAELAKAVKALQELL